MVASIIVPPPGGNSFARTADLGPATERTGSVVVIASRSR